MDVFLPVPPCPTVMVAFVVKIVVEAFGSAYVFTDADGPEKAMKALLVPPFALGKMPLTWVVNPTLPQLETVVTPPEISTFPVATDASLESVVLADACNMSPMAYVPLPVPPKLAPIACVRSADPSKLFP